MPRSVHIVPMCYSGQIHVPAMMTLFESFVSLTAAGLKVSMEPSTGDSLITRARNAVVTQFLERGDDELVMVDDDVSSEPGAMLRLLEHPVDMVAALYPGRGDPEQYPLRIDASKPFIASDPQTKLIEVDAVPTGFFRVSRSCLLRMTDAFRNREYHDDKLPGKMSVDLFGNGLENGRYWGEDFAFCRRWRSIGGKVWADPELHMRHTGLKTFTGRFGDYMRNRPGYAAEREAFIAQGGVGA